MPSSDARQDPSPDTRLMDLTEQTMTKTYSFAEVGLTIAVSLFVLDIVAMTLASLA